MGGLTGSAAVAAVALIALSSAAAAASPGVGYKSATPYLYAYLNQNGCATTGLHRPSISTITGVGHAWGKTSAMTCFPVKGGYKTQSYGDSDSELGVAVAKTLASNLAYVNTTFNVSAIVNATASGKISHCPYVSSYDNFTIGTGWENYSYVQQDCFAEAGVDVDPQVQICDYSQNTCWGFGLAGIYISAGVYADNYTETFTYSSATLGTNTTYSCTSCYGSLGAGTTQTVNQNINSSINVLTYHTFAKGDSVQISADMFISCYSEIEGAKSAHASAFYNAQTAGGHIDLIALTIV